MEPDKLPCLQEPASNRHPEPDESIPNRFILFKIHFSNILTYI